MPPLDDLRDSWSRHARTAGFHPSIAFTDEGAVLGAGTVLARDEEDIDRRAERVLALLSTAYRRPVLPSVLASLRHAAQDAARGRDRRSASHLAHTGLPSLDPEDEAAYRLFMADRLLAAGIAPRLLLEAQDIDTGPLDLLEHQFD